MSIPPTPDANGTVSIGRTTKISFCGQQITLPCLVQVYGRLNADGTSSAGNPCSGKYFEIGPLVNGNDTLVCSQWPLTGSPVLPDFHFTYEAGASFSSSQGAGASSASEQGASSKPGAGSDCGKSTNPVGFPVPKNPCPPGFQEA